MLEGDGFEEWDGSVEMSIVACRRPYHSRSTPCSRATHRQYQRELRVAQKPTHNHRDGRARRVSQEICEPHASVRLICRSLSYDEAFWFGGAPWRFPREGNRFIRGDASANERASLAGTDRSSFCFVARWGRGAIRPSVQWQRVIVANGRSGCSP
jgi:hypothetical protein